ncbi:hypothetical protein [Arthrobacter sp.]|uniref:hypothetical protein n=1 Tax=Arthrobacter sp. TaxID=1667 RepID=UPI003A8E0533
MEARVNDDELADTMLESVKDLPDNGPRISEYTPVVERLDTLADMLSALQATVIAAAGGKPGRQRPAKRPSTAISRAQKARADRNYTDLLSEVEAAQERWQARITE